MSLLQKRISDLWGAFGNFVLGAGRIAVDAIKEMEGHFTVMPNTLKPCQGLSNRASRVALCASVLQGCNTSQKLGQKVIAEQRKQLVEMHWRTGNPNLTSEKVSDHLLRQNWASAVPLDCLRINLGQWCEKEEDPWPSWALILKAPLYRDDKYGEHLAIMRDPPRRPERQHTSDDQQRMYKFGEQRMWAWRRTSDTGVPVGVKDIKARLVLVRATMLERLSEFSATHVVNGALLVIWGSPAEVEQCTNRVPKLGVHIRDVAVDYFIKAGDQPDHYCRHLVMHIIGLKSVFTAKVCPFNVRYPFCKKMFFCTLSRAIIFNTHLRAILHVNFYFSQF